MIKHITSRFVYFVCCIFLLFNSFFSLGQKPKNPPKEWIHRIEPRSIDQIFVVEEKKTVTIDTTHYTINEGKKYIPSGWYPGLGCTMTNSLTYLPLEKELLIRIVDPKGNTIKNYQLFVSNNHSIEKMIHPDSNGVFHVLLLKESNDWTFYYQESEKNVPHFWKFIDGQKICISDEYYASTYIPIYSYTSRDSNEVTIQLPWIRIPEHEKVVKSKFDFRDVQQLSTRYKDVFLRY